ncbi:phage minor tail protein L, partial [Escherichia coli EC1856]
VVCAGRDVAR